MRPHYIQIALLQESGRGGYKFLKYSSCLALKIHILQNGIRNSHKKITAADHTEIH